MKASAMAPAALINTPLGPMTRDQIAACYGLARGTVIRRMWLHGRGLFPAEKLFDPPAPKVRREHMPQYRREGCYPTPYGRMSQDQISAVTGLSVGCIKERLYNWRRRWSNEHAFNTPKYGKPGVDHIMPPQEWAAGVAALHAAEAEQRAKDRADRLGIERHARRVRVLRQPAGAASPHLEEVAG